jgi:uncharacterized protein YprB with RNaseH-like and TPR domain
VLRAETRERLRALISDIESRPAPTPRIAAPPTEGLPPLEGIARRSTPNGVCSYREVRYLLDEHVVGRQPLASIRRADALALGTLAPDIDLTGASLEDLLFLDIETTGLGGAGAIAFLVATGRVEGATFVLRQYLAHSPAEEGALLDALLEDARLEEDPILVTYNGRAFDAPFIDGRATMHRRRAGFDSLAHVDILVPARAFYRGWLPSCRLATIESEILGLTRPSADVDGAEVPAWYFRYLRTGDMRFVQPIASHNLIDVVALAALTGRLAELVSGPPPCGAEALGLARLRGLDSARVTTALHAARATLPDGPLRGEASWLLAQRLKRGGARDQALDLWRELVEHPGPWRLAAFEEMAKHLEHRARDVRAAHEAVVCALAVLGRLPSTESTERQIRAFRYRLARLTSKLGLDS